MKTKRNNKDTKNKNNNLEKKKPKIRVHMNYKHQNSSWEESGRGDDGLKHFTVCLYPYIIHGFSVYLPL